MSTASTHPLNFSYSLPNFVTAIRVVLACIVAVLLSIGTDGSILAAGIVLAAAALTDWADGFLARRMKKTSLFGSLFDMIADQLLFMPALILAVTAGLFSRAGGIFVWNPYLYAIPALLGGVFVLAGITIYLIKRRTQDIEFPTPTKVAKYNFWFWLAPLVVAIFQVGPDWLLAGLMYLAVISTIATFYSYLKKGGYIFTK